VAVHAVKRKPKNNREDITKEDKVLSFFFENAGELCIFVFKERRNGPLQIVPHHSGPSYDGQLTYIDVTL